MSDGFFRNELWLTKRDDEKARDVFHNYFLMER